MKKIISLLLLLPALPVGAQRYVVSGTAPAGVTMVYLQNLQAERGALPDSCAVAGGKFRFSGEAAGHPFAQVVAGDADFRPYVVLDGDVTVDFSARTVGGTPENDGLQAAREQLRPASERLRALQQEAAAFQAQGAEMPDTTEKRIAAAYETAFDSLLQGVRRVCDANTNRIFPAIYIRQYYYMMDKADLVRYVDEQAAFMSTPSMERLRQAADGWRRQLPGQQFTDLEEVDTLGVSHKLSEFVGKGNYVLVDFWASWCGPCMAEVPNVKALYDKYHSRGFDIVGLSFDSKKEAWVGAINRTGMNWHHLSDLKGWGTLAAQTYGINAIPATLLVDPDGKIVANDLRGEALQKKLAEIYGD